MAPTTSPTTARTELRLHGEHDLSTAVALAETVACAIADDDEADLVLDLSDVSFMDASTITVILRARTYLGDRHRALQLRDPSRSSRRLLELCELEDLIRISRHPVAEDRSRPAIPRVRRPAAVISKAS